MLSTLGFLIVGCAGATEPAPAQVVPTTQAPVLEPSSEPEPSLEPEFSIEGVDFAALEWSLSHHGEMLPTEGLSFATGPAIIETVEYTIGVEGIVYGDADGDGDLDAIVPVSALEVMGGGVDLGTAWYLWSDAGGAAVQAPVPAAVSNCDIVVESVAAVTGGFEIHEFHLRSGEESYTACGEGGTDERIRTVAINADGPDGEFWPVQVAPFISFGGACPISIAFHADSATTDHFPTPNAASTPLAGAQINTWPVEEWQIFRDGYPGWKLVGVNVDGASGCAWTQL